jgi:hypothetical protein
MINFVQINVYIFNWYEFDYFALFNIKCYKSGLNIVFMADAQIKFL